MVVRAVQHRGGGVEPRASPHDVRIAIVHQNAELHQGGDIGVAEIEAETGYLLVGGAGVIVKHTIYRTHIYLDTQQFHGEVML